MIDDGVKVLGFHPKELHRIRVMMDVLGFTSADEFCNAAIANGIPCLREKMIAHYEEKIAELRAGMVGGQ